MAHGAAAYLPLLPSSGKGSGNRRKAYEGRDEEGAARSEHGQQGCEAEGEEKHRGGGGGGSEPGRTGKTAVRESTFSYVCVRTYGRDTALRYCALSLHRPLPCAPPQCSFHHAPFDSLEARSLRGEVQGDVRDPLIGQAGHRLCDSMYLIGQPLCETQSKCRSREGGGRGWRHKKWAGNGVLLAQALLLCCCDV